MLDALKVVGVADAQDVPVITEKAGGDVFRERDLRIALDGDVVVVPDPAKVVPPKRARPRPPLRRDAFHHATVAAHGVDAVVKDVEARPVVALGEPLLGDGHAHAGGHPLPKWTGGSLDARNPVVLGVTGG